MERISVIKTQMLEMKLKELQELAKEKGIKIILLIENPNWYEDMMRHNYRTRLKPKQFRGMLFSLCSKYDVTPVGVPREFVGSFIYNSLYYKLRDELKEQGIKL